MRYLITGGCGFIGSHLVDKLLANQCDVLVLDNLSTGYKENIPADVAFVEGDVTDKKLVRELLQKVDGCFHLAAISSVALCECDSGYAHAVNYLATENLFELAGSKPVVYASSAAVYGEPASLSLTETTPCQPISQYGADKYACEKAAQLSAEKWQSKRIGLRFFNVYGPRQNPSSDYAGVITKFISTNSAGKPLTIYGDGEQTRDFVYVGDIVEASYQVMTASSLSYADIFNVCTGVATSIKQLAGLVSGQPLTYSARQSSDIKHSLGSPEKLLEAVGYKPGTSLEFGLKALLESL